MQSIDDIVRRNFAVTPRASVKTAPSLDYAPDSVKLYEAIDSASNEFGTDSNLIKKVMHQESRGFHFDPYGKVLTSSAGALGRMQLMPETAKALQVNPEDPVENIRGGAKLLSLLQKKYGSDEAKILAAYNWGEPGVDRAVRKYGSSWLNYAPAETKDYIQKITGSDPATMSFEGKVGDALPLQSIDAIVAKNYGLEMPKPAPAQEQSQLVPQESVSTGEPMWDESQELEKSPTAQPEAKKPSFLSQYLTPDPYVKTARSIASVPFAVSGAMYDIGGVIPGKIGEKSQKLAAEQKELADYIAGKKGEQATPEEMKAAAENMSGVEAWLRKFEDTLLFGQGMTDEQRSAIQEAKPITSMAADLPAMIVPIVGTTGAVARGLKAAGPVANLLLKHKVAGKAVVDATARGSAFAADYSIRNSEALTSKDEDIRNKALIGLSTGVAASVVSVAPEMLKNGWYQPVLQSIVGGATNTASRYLMGDELDSKEGVTSDILQYALGAIGGFGSLRAPKVSTKTGKIDPAQPEDARIDPNAMIDDGAVITKQKSEFDKGKIKKESLSAPNKKKLLLSDEEVQQMTPEQLAEAYKSVRDAASTDKMTGLRNRTALAEEIEEFGGYGESKTLAMDLDKFKNVNDTFGHKVGDEALKIYANSLKKHLEPIGGKVYRVGGEEITAIFPQNVENSVILKAEALAKEELANTKIPTGDKNNPELEGLTFSSGLGKGFDDADSKLYEVKGKDGQEGKGRGGISHEGGYSGYSGTKPKTGLWYEKQLQVRGREATEPEAPRTEAEPIETSYGRTPEEESFFDSLSEVDAGILFDPAKNIDHIDIPESYKPDLAKIRHENNIGRAEVEADGINARADLIQSLRDKMANDKGKFSFSTEALRRASGNNDQQVSYAKAGGESADQARIRYASDEDTKRIFNELTKEDIDTIQPEDFVSILTSGEFSKSEVDALRARAKKIVKEAKDTPVEDFLPSKKSSSEETQLPKEPETDGLEDMFGPVTKPTPDQPIPTGKQREGLGNAEGKFDWGKSDPQGTGLGENLTTKQEAKQNIKKFLTSKGLNPDEIFNAKTKLHGFISEQAGRTEDAMVDYRIGLNEAYGKKSGRKLDDAEQFKINQVLNGKADFSTIPEQLRRPLSHLIRQKRQLSRIISESGLVKEGSVSDFDINNWVNRSYRVFDDPNHYKKVTKETVEAAKTFLKKQHLGDVAKKKEAVSSKMTELLSEKAKIENSFKNPISQEEFIKLNEKKKDLENKIFALRRDSGTEGQGSARDALTALIKQRDAAKAEGMIVYGGKTLTPQETRRVRNMIREAEALENKVEDANAFEVDDIQDAIDDIDNAIEGMFKTDVNKKARSLVSKSEKGIVREKEIAALESEIAQIQQKLQEPVSQNQIGENLRKLEKLNKSLEENIAKQNELENEAVLTDERLTGEINRLLFKNAPAENVLDAMGKMGSIAKGILERRKDIPFEIRALWGEYQQADINAARSISKAAHMLGNYRFMQEIKEAGLNKFFFEEPTGKNYVPVAAEASKSMEPLAGLYTTKAIADELSEQFSPKAVEGWLRLWMKGVATTRVAKTVLSPATHAGNFMSNILIATANADINAGTLQESAKAMSTELLKLPKPEFRKKILYWKKLGIIGESINAGELRDIIRDATQTDMDIILSSGITGAARKGMRTATKMYAAGDDFWKINAFLNKKKQYQKADASITDEQVAEIVKNTYPTYSRVPRITRMMRRFPLTGNFVSWPSEVIRVTYGTMKQAAKDVTSKNSAIKEIGMKRLVGLLTAATIPTMIGAAGALMSGVGIGSKEEKSFRKFVAPWHKNTEMLLFSKPDGEGKGSFIDIGRLDPFAYVKKPILALLQGTGDWEERFWESIGELATPFTGENIFTKAVREAMLSNRKQDGGLVSNPYDNFVKQGYDRGLYLFDAMSPGVVASVRRIAKATEGQLDASGNPYNAVNESIAAATGIRVSTIDFHKSLQFAARKYNSDKQDLQSLYRKQNRPEDLTGPENFLKDKIEGARALGMSDEQITDALKAGGVSSIEAAFVEEDYKTKIAKSLGETGKYSKEKAKAHFEYFKERGYKMSKSDFMGKYRALAVSNLGSDDLIRLSKTKSQRDKDVLINRIIEKEYSGLTGAQKSQKRKNLNRASRIYKNLPKE